jgi:hypothetical protein
MKTRIINCLIGVGLLTLSAAQANADPLPIPGESETGWRHSLEIVSFAPISTTGSSTIAGRTVPVDMNLRDVLEVLDFALEGRYEAWNGDFGVILDANYVGIGDDGPFPAPAGSTFSVNVRQKWLGLLAAYRVVDGTYGANNQRFTVDLQGGARYNSLRQEIIVRTPGGPLPTVGGDESWWEPVIGARGMWRLNDKWTTVASLNLGGFGAGGNDLQIGANLGFDYRPWERTSLVFGYRYYSIDYSTTLSGGTFAYDSSQHGPYFGVKIRFK